MTTNAEAIRRLFRIGPDRDRTGNLPSLPGIFIPLIFLDPAF
jgi:hypothetical protein